MAIFKFFLFPFSIFFAAVVWVRRMLYASGLFSTYMPSLPTIVVGNLSTGGTGKTPHVEYLIRCLTPTFKVATLSRGYKRKTKGFLLANTSSTALDIGDEPMQFCQKFKEITVAVDEKRARGLAHLYQHYPKVDVVLLDDAYQHLQVRGGYTILLTDFHRLFVHDYLLPVGNLRECRSGYKRADTIIVTKCPKGLSSQEKQVIRDKIKPLPHQDILFSYIDYLPLVSLDGMPCTCSFDSVLLLTGIAHNDSLKQHIQSICQQVYDISFPDHHTFTCSDMMQITKTFNNIASLNKIIVTTEKDAMRLMHPAINRYIEGFPLYYMPIQMAFNAIDSEILTKKVHAYVNQNKRK